MSTLHRIQLEESTQKDTEKSCMRNSLRNEKLGLITKPEMLTNSKRTLSFQSNIDRLSFGNRNAQKFLKCSEIQDE